MAILSCGHLVTISSGKISKAYLTSFMEKSLVTQLISAGVGKRNDIMFSSFLEGVSKSHMQTYFRVGGWEMYLTFHSYGQMVLYPWGYDR